MVNHEAIGSYFPKLGERLQTEEEPPIDAGSGKSPDPARLPFAPLGGQAATTISEAQGERPKST